MSSVASATQWTPHSNHSRVAGLAGPGRVDSFLVLAKHFVYMNSDTGYLKFARRVKQSASEQRWTINERRLRADSARETTEDGGAAACCRSGLGGRWKRNHSDTKLLGFTTLPNKSDLQGKAHYGLPVLYKETRKDHWTWRADSTEQQPWWWACKAHVTEWAQSTLLSACTAHPSLVEASFIYTEI